jgi:putative transposase
MRFLTRLAQEKKKSQKRNPKTAPEQVKKTKELTQWLEARRNEIELGELVVFFQDECYLIWGDICGYVWGKKNERVEVPIVNEKERQTYFGSVNIATGQCLLDCLSQGKWRTYY